MVTMRVFIGWVSTRSHHSRTFGKVYIVSQALSRGKEGSDAVKKQPRWDEISEESSEDEGDLVLFSDSEQPLRTNSSR